MATTKKAPAKKKTIAKKSTVSRAKKQPEFQSFKISADPKPFTSMKITRQTVYWIILVGFIVFSQMWILKLQLDIADLTNSLITVQSN